LGDASLAGSLLFTFKDLVLEINGRRVRLEAGSVFSLEISFSKLGWSSSVSRGSSFTGCGGPLAIPTVSKSEACDTSLDLAPSSETGLFADMDETLPSSFGTE
jgi:hypothetical protein